MGLWWWWRKFSNKVNPFLLGAHGHLFKTISPCATHSEKLFFVVIFNRNLLKGSKKIFGHLLQSLYSLLFIFRLFSSNNRQCAFTKLSVYWFASIWIVSLPFKLIFPRYCTVHAKTLFAFTSFCRLFPRMMFLFFPLISLFQDNALFMQKYCLLLHLCLLLFIPENFFLFFPLLSRLSLLLPHFVFRVISHQDIHANIVLKYSNFLSQKSIYLYLPFKQLSINRFM